MLRPVLVTPPVGDIVTSAEMKAHARVDSADDDTLLTALVRAATAHLDGWSGILGRCLLTQSWKVSRRGFSPFWMRLPFPDVSAATVAYFDVTDSKQDLAGSNYELIEDEIGPLVRFRKAFSAPAIYDDRSDAVQVTFQAGYGTAADVPQPIKQAIMMLAAHWYGNREASVVGIVPAILPLGVDALIAPYRRMRV